LLLQHPRPLLEILLAEDPAVELAAADDPPFSRIAERPGGASGSALPNAST